VRKASAAVVSSNTIIDGIGRPHQAVLALLCDGKRITAALQWSSYLGLDQVWVEWRVDDVPIRNEVWGLPRGGLNKAFSMEGKPTRRLLDAMRAGRELVIRVHGYGMTQDAVFDVSSAPAAIESARAACPQDE
jgi:hypothetical protein